MRVFELWLDESGSFDHDDRIGPSSNPSLIGGLLSKYRSITKEQIDRVIPDTYHSTEVNDRQDQFQRFQMITELGTLVTFNNQERIMVIDNNLTYQVIMAEGIVQLILALRAKYGEIHLNILIANRVDTTRPGTETVPEEDYLKRLRERILIEGLGKHITEDDYTIRLDSARKNKKLMIADIVCNTILTGINKFSGEQRDFIYALRDDHSRSYTFRVLQSGSSRQFQSFLMEDRIGEAAALACQGEEKGALERDMAVLKERLRSLPVKDLELQYKVISAWVEYYVNVERNYRLCLRFFNNLLQFFIPVLKEAAPDFQSLAEKFELDLHFWRLTVYTHQGDIRRAEEEEALCDELLFSMPVDWASIEYRLSYELRKIVSRINELAYPEALEGVNALIWKCREAKEAMELICSGSEIQLGILGKALGTALQVYTMTLSQHPENYEKAVQLSEEAIEEFRTEPDRRRQYQYRANLEAEAGHFDEAYSWICRAFGLDENAKLQDLARTADLFVTSSNVFGVGELIRLMAYGKAAGWEKADDLYEALDAESVFRDLDAEKENTKHPYELIYWRCASYLASAGSLNAAKKNYEKAAALGWEMGDATTRMITIAIELEELGLLIEKGDKAEKDLRRKISSQIVKLQTQAIISRTMKRFLLETLDLKAEDPLYFRKMSKFTGY